MNNSLSQILVRFILAVLLAINIQSVIGQTVDVQLTDEEKAYLHSIGPVTFCVDPDWAPFEYLDENKQYKGIAADLMQLISQRAGIEFKLLPTKDWDESLLRSANGDCILLPFLNQTPDREQWLLFTNYYFTDYNVLITREEHEFIPDLSVLKNTSIALPHGTSIEERIRREYPNLSILLVENESAAISAVNDRQADMTIRSLTVAAYVIKSEGWFNLKIAGHLPDFTNRLGIGVSKEHPILRNILNKAIRTISAQDVHQAVNNHISFTIVEDEDYTLIMQVLIVLSILVIAGLSWNYQLRRLNQKLNTSKKDLTKLSEQLKKDIKAREKVEAELKNSERHLSSLIANLPGFIYQCLNDEHYKMLFISNGCVEITGYQPEDFISGVVEFSEVILPDELPDIRKRWETALASRSRFEHEYRIIRSDGEIRWVWERGYGVFDNDGKLIILEGFIDDITDRRLAEEKLMKREIELRELNVRKDKFFSIIAHDLKSPFNGVLSLSQMLVEQIKEKDYSGIEYYATLMWQSSERVMNLLLNLLEWAQSQTGRIVFSPEFFDLHAFMEENILIYDDIAAQKNIKIKRTFAGKISIIADKHMLSSVLRNLISNAIKFSYSGGEITITTHKNQTEIVISVSDNGQGMPKTRIEKLFNIDQSESTPGTANEKGTGLGLILCNEFVEMHNGKIWAESVEGKGTSFNFTIPLK